VTGSARADAGISTDAARLIQVLAVGLLSVLGATSMAQDSNVPLYGFLGPATWVDIAAPLYDAPDPTEGIADGSSILLFDRQIDVTVEGDEQYEHLAVKLWTTYMLNSRRVGATFVKRASPGPLTVTGDAVSAA
jgi:hypothetical protein